MTNVLEARRWSAARLSGRRQVLLVTGVAFLLVALYAGIGIVALGGGFPLDDSWIHQTYARNLALTGRWQYGPGQISAGSTAPLWTLLLAIGHLARLPNLLWAYLLGWLCLAWVGRSAMDLWRILRPERAQLAWLAGLVVISCWQLVWAAASGMETLLFAALVLQALVLYLRPGMWDDQRALLLGIVSGASILTRPEGVLMLACLAVGVMTSNGPLSRRARVVALLAVGSAALLIPYFSFNLTTSGHLWPNTFYAKQAEYAVASRQRLPLKFVQLLYFGVGGTDNGWQGISGARWLLIPGLLAGAYWVIRDDWSDHRWRKALPLSWALGHVFLYAWRLPVTYQHGRYFWPAIPVLMIYGLFGWEEISAPIISWFNERISFIVRSVFKLTYGVLAGIFLLLGLQAFVADVSLIEGEMVEAAHWLRNNTPADALVAAHDIGALGYYAERSILDLAGLVTPDVVPLLSDEKGMADYISQQDVDYLVTAPGWSYEDITADPGVTEIFVSDHEPTRLAGLNNTTVFKLGK